MARHDIMGGTTQCGDRHRDRSAVELVGRIIGNQTKLRQEFMSEERRERDESTVDQLAPVGEIPAKVPRIPVRSAGGSIDPFTVVFNNRWEGNVLTFQNQAQGIHV